jgi:hypothetical protein
MLIRPITFMRRTGLSVGPIPTLHTINMDALTPYEPAYPAGISAGDWLLAIAMSADGTSIAGGTFAPQEGFADLGASPFDAVGANRQTRTWIRGRTAAGTETANLQFTLSLESVAAIARFSAVNVSSPIEGLQFATFNDDPHTIPTITSSGPNRLAVFILAVGELAGSPSNPLVGGSGPAPVLINQLGTTVGNDRQLLIYAVAMPTQGSISGYQQTIDYTAHQAGFLGFFVKPTGS